MQIDGVETEKMAEDTRKEILSVQMVTLNKLEVMRKRLVWNSILGLLNMGLLAGVIWMLSQFIPLI